MTEEATSTGLSTSINPATRQVDSEAVHVLGRLHQTFRHRRVRMDGLGHSLGGCAYVHGNGRLMNEIRGVRADEMHPHYFPAGGIGDDFEQPGGIAGGMRLAEFDGLEFADLD